MRVFFLKTALLTGAVVFFPVNPALSESPPPLKLAQSGLRQTSNALLVNAPPVVPGNPLVPMPPPQGGDFGYPPGNTPPPEIYDVPPAPPQETNPPPSLSKLFDLSQLPNMPSEDPFNSPGESTHRYPQGEKSEEQKTIEQFDYTSKTVIFYLPCKEKTGASCKRPLLTNRKNTMFKYDKNRNINISGIGDTKTQKEATVSETKEK